MQKKTDEILESAEKNYVSLADLTNGGKKIYSFFLKQLLFLA